MPEGRRSVTERLLLDVNALSILLVGDHPGYEYVRDRLDPGLRGEDALLVSDYLPLRAQWVLTTQWDIDRVRARNAVTSVMEQPLELVAASRETLRAAYEISAAEDHDIYDCFYVALARQHDADALVTTDRDFETLCAGESFGYANPVPEEVLARFSEV